jgi:hypothetical protein
MRWVGAKSCLSVPTCTISCFGANWRQYTKYKALKQSGGALTWGAAFLPPAEEENIMGCLRCRRAMAWLVSPSRCPACDDLLCLSLLLFRCLTR